MTDLQQRAQTLKLNGLLAHWDEIHSEPWVADLVTWEEQERARRGLERRMRRARLGTFKPIADFDWDWPKKIDRAQIEDLFNLDWIAAATNVVIVGGNGLGKSLIAKNLAQEAAHAGTTVRFVTASEMLNTLAEQDSSIALQRKLALFARPGVLAVDELGYLSYDNRHADLLFEVISRRYEKRPTILTTNKAFVDWGEVFPNATTVVSIVDRIVHRCEVVKIEGESYRLKEAKEAARQRAAERRKKTRRRVTNMP